jgi:hypothetical protein
MIPARLSEGFLLLDWHAVHQQTGFLPWIIEVPAKNHGRQHESSSSFACEARARAGKSANTEFIR